MMAMQKQGALPAAKRAGDDEVGPAAGPEDLGEKSSGPSDDAKPAEALSSSDPPAPCAPEPVGGKRRWASSRRPGECSVLRSANAQARTKARTKAGSCT